MRKTTSSEARGFKYVEYIKTEDARALLVGFELPDLSEQPSLKPGASVLDDDRVQLKETLVVLLDELVDDHAPIYRGAFGVAVDRILEKYEVTPRG